MRIRAWLSMAAACVVTLAGAGSARAFNYGEHHDIAATAVRALPAHDREHLVRMHDELSERECPAADLSLATERQKVTCVSVADLGALAGDHACSAPELGQVVAKHDWTLRVIERAMQVRRGLQERRGLKTAFNELWRASDLDLDLIDAAYGSRASSNDAHFALPRASDALDTYLYETLEVDRPALNAVGLYAMFHAAALRFGVEASRTEEPSVRRALLQRAMLVESFGVHFLEDMFSSGHIVGTFGDIATKKGTHDLYSEIGLDVRTWRGKSYGAYGDAHMENEDLQHAAPAIAKTYAQLVRAAQGDPLLVHAVDRMPLTVAERIYAFDVCRETNMPADKVVDRRFWPLLEDVLADTPVPARSTSLLPRGRAEVGVFLGIGSGVRGIVNTLGVTGGAGTGAAELELSGRAGVSLTDVVGPRSDGRIAVEVGRAFGAGATASPDEAQARPDLRRAYKFGLHLPFFLLPGDLLVLGPVLGLTSPKTLEAVAITSVNGGLIPWQRPILTRAGDVQFLFGRKVDVFLYDRHDAYAAGSPLPVASLRSVALTSHIVEWRPLRQYTLGTSLGFSVRLSAGAEIPFGLVEQTPDSGVRLRSSFTTALGFEFWGRRFL